MNRQAQVLWAVAVCAVIAFAYFIWPTPWRPPANTGFQASVEATLAELRGEDSRIARFPGLADKAPIYLAACVALAFARFVWPTPWAYHPYKTPEGLQTVMRVNRFSGRTEALLEDGWRVMGKG